MSPLEDAAHRPWPPPRRPWLMGMCWHDLLFAHWPLAPASLRPLIPPGLEVDTFDGRAWLGVVPFRMSRTGPRFARRLPWVSAFPELNVRTYVTAGGKPGVWFFSLDAANPLAVRAARRCFHLPYFDAQMNCQERGGWIEYRSRRTHRGSAAGEFVGRYRPTGPEYRALPGTLDRWLTERYCLYAASPAGRVFRGEIHHRPWPLQPAEAEIEVNTAAAHTGIALPDVPPLLHFARYLDVIAWGLEGV